MSESGTEVPRRQLDWREPTGEDRRSWGIAGRSFLLLTETTGGFVCVYARTESFYVVWWRRYSEAMPLAMARRRGIVEQEYDSLESAIEDVEAEVDERLAAWERENQDFRAAAVEAEERRLQELEAVRAKYRSSGQLGSGEAAPVTSRWTWWLGIGALGYVLGLFLTWILVAVADRLLASVVPGFWHGSFEYSDPYGGSGLASSRWPLDFLTDNLLFWLLAPLVVASLAGYLVGHWKKL